MFEKIEITEDNLLEFLAERVYAKDSEFDLELFQSKGRGRSGRERYYMHGDLIGHLWVIGQINRAPRFSVFPDQDVIEKANNWIKRKRKILVEAAAALEQANAADSKPAANI